MRNFHVFLLPKPVGITARVPLVVEGTSLETIPVESASIASFSVTFEETETALSTFPRMFCEPDGSFVWRSSSPEDPWQVDGLLADRAGSLVQVEVKGTCPSNALDRLLMAVGWPGTEVAFQLAKAGVLVDEAEFRRFLYG